MAQQKQKLRPSPLDDPPTASSSEEEEEDQQPQQPSSQQQQQQQQRQPEDDEEEVSSSSEEASSQEDEEEEDDHLPPPSKNPPPPPPTQSQPSSSETDTESGSETESEPEPSPAKVKPLASKPMDQAQTQTQTQKPKPQPSLAPPKGLKRPVENNPVTDPKRSKKKPTNSSSSTPAAAAASDDEMEEDGKKSGDQAKKARLWREEDELVILKGMVEFTSKTGQDPLKVSNANAFLDFMKKLLHKEVTNTQLKEKVRRLKKKFETTAEKLKTGEAPTKPRDQKFFELSKKVWGGERGSAASVAAANGPVVEKSKSNGSVAKTPTKKKESSGRNVGSARKPKPETKPDPPEQEKLPLLSKESEKMDVDQKSRGGCSSLLLRELCNHKDGVFLDEDVVQRGLELIGESKRAELEEKWRKLCLAEMNLFAERQLLIGEQTRMIVEALQSSNK